MANARHHERQPEPADGKDCTRVGADAAAWLPCLSAAAEVATGEGLVPAGWLRPGDLVLTRDSGLQPILWIGRCRLTRAEALARTEAWPVHLAPGALGHGAPPAPLTVAPAHRLLVRGAELQQHLGLIEAFAAARDLAGRPGVEVVAPHGPLDLYLILLDRHEAIVAGGLWVESLHPADIPAEVLSMPGAGRLRDLAAAAAATGARATRPVLAAWETVFLPATTEAAGAGATSASALLQTA